MNDASSLSLNALGFFNYLHDTLTQPLGSWEGFHRPLSQSMNFALRYQIAFSTYAVAMLQQATPAYRGPHIEVMQAAIEKMLHRDVWGYWRVPEPQPKHEHKPSQSSTQLTLMAAPPKRTVSAPSDPIAQNNLQYSGHLSTILGLYEKLSGEHTYDEPFMLKDAASGVEFSYTHSKVAERIHAQMVQNKFGGVCCEQGMAYVPCNNHAMASNTLHDALHGTQYAEANAGWLKTVRGKLVLKGPALRGVFGTAYIKDFGLATPVAFNFTDAWGLAFMVPFARPLVRRLYGKFKRRAISRAGSDGAYVGSHGVSERMEISDIPVNTGFGMILSRAMSDAELASDIQRYSEQAFGAKWEGAKYYYAGATRALHATALYALAEAMQPGGDDFVRLFNNPPDQQTKEQPYLSSVQSNSGSIGVSQARYNASTQTLQIGLRQVGDPAVLRDGKTVLACLVLRNVAGKVCVEGMEEGAVKMERLPNGDLSLGLSVNPLGESVLTIPCS